MVEIIFDALAYIFVEIFFQGLKFLGLLVIKLLTLGNSSMEELKLKYDKSITPYLIGVGVLVGLVYLIFY